MGTPLVVSAKEALSVLLLSLLVRRAGILRKLLHMSEGERWARMGDMLAIADRVKPAGCVLITFKSRLSIPPYRIENKTSDVMIYFAQSSVASDREKWNWLSPRSSGSSMAYAWDEPCQTHKLQVQVIPFAFQTAEVSDMSVLDSPGLINRFTIHNYWQSNRRGVREDA